MPNNFKVLDAEDTEKIMGSKTQTEGTDEIHIPKRAIQNGDDAAFGATSDTPASDDVEDATFIALFKRFLLRLKRGASNFATGEIIVDTLETEIVPERLTRRSITIINLTTAPIKIVGTEIGSVGATLIGLVGAALTLNVNCTVIATGPGTISFIEEYD